MIAAVRLLQRETSSLGPPRYLLISAAGSGAAGRELLPAHDLSLFLKLRISGQVKPRLGHLRRLSGRPEGVLGSE